jgi:hypothetical protein
VTPGNRHDSQIAPDLVASICTKFLAIHTVAVDAGYKTASFVEFLRLKNLHLVLSYTRPRGDRRCIFSF